MYHGAVRVATPQVRGAGARALGSAAVLFVVGRLVAAPAAAEPRAQPIEDPCLARQGEACPAHALDPVYRALLRVERKEPGAVARVTQFGDSLTADDYIPGRGRARLQAQFGDGGAGFVYAGQPSRWYLLREVEHSASGWAVQSIIAGTSRDHLCGLGGAAFEAAAAGPSARFATLRKGPLGDKVSRFDVYYLEQPGGGPLVAQIDDGPEQRIETAGPAARSGFHAITVPDGAHALILRAAGPKVRVFGVTLEREGPGAVVDSLGTVGNAARFLNQIDPAHLAEQLGHRAPSLVIVFLGANEADYWGTDAAAISDYQAGYEKLLAQMRAGAPDAACLVMAPLDTDMEKDGKLVTKPALPRLVEAQKRAAAAQGCAFWDTFAWMGGRGSMAKWFKRGLSRPDYQHPTIPGGAKVADALYAALLHGYDEFVAAGGR